MIRPIQHKDIPTICSLMKEFADFDGSSSELNIDYNQFSEVFSPDNNSIHTLVLDLDEKVEGFINYYYTFSSFELSKCIWVEDAFIREQFRSQGWGQKLFEAVKDTAAINQCARIDWLVRSDNENGKNFYTKIGAKVDPSTIHVKWKIEK